MIMKIGLERGWHVPGARLARGARSASRGASGPPPRVPPRGALRGAAAPREPRAGLSPRWAVPPPEHPRHPPPRRLEPPARRDQKEPDEPRPVRPDQRGKP